MMRILLNEELANFNEILNHILGVIFIILIFSIAYAYLKPHRLHKRRPWSTLLLKGSYLFYLMTLLVVVYFSALVRGGLEIVFSGIEFFVFLLVLFAPTAGIFARKLAQFSKKREEYNYFFTAVNIVAVIAVLLMYFI